MKPLKGRPHSRFSSSIITFDVENNPDTSEFILASVYGMTLKRSHSQYKETLVKETFFSKEAFQKFLMDLRPQKDIDRKKRHPCVLIAYNASYDMGFLREIEQSSCRIDGNRFITTKLKNGLIVIDLMNHVTGSLKENVKIFSSEIPDLEKTDLPESDDIISMALHCEADAKSTYDIANYVLNGFYAKMHLTPKYTKAAMALQSFLRFALKETWEDRSTEINDFERSGYYGGRTEIFHRGDVLNTVSFDVNSMYPSRAVKELLPDPQTVIKGYGNNSMFKKHFRTHDMMIECTIRVPKQKICPLPYRKDGKLIFPYGVLHGVWCSPELIYAIDHCGCEIIDIGQWLLYHDQIDDLKNYMEFWYNERLKWRKNGNKAMETLCKYLLNSLTGKFGEHIKDKRLVNINDTCVTKDDLRNSSSYDWNGETYIEIKSEEYEDTDHTFPVVIAFITAYSRVYLLDAMKSIEKDVVYCDTDSVHCFKEAKKRFESLNWVSNDKKDLGAFSYEGEHDQKYYRPKFYGDHAKGINLERATKTYEDDNEVAYAIKKPNRRRASIKRNLIENQWLWTEKIFSKWDDKRNWNKDGTSNPIMIDINQ